MTTYNVRDEDFAALQGKIILITGSVTGIGRATALLAHSKIYILRDGFFDATFCCDELIIVTQKMEQT